MSRSKLGYLFIELILVLFLMSILYVLIRPMYDSYLLKIKRKDAELTLLAFATKMNNYYATHNHSYVGASIDLLDQNGIFYSKYYSYKLNSATDTAYLLTATPIFGDRICGSISIDQSGDKFFSNEMANLDACWNID